MDKDQFRIEDDQPLRSSSDTRILRDPDEVEWRIFQDRCKLNFGRFMEILSRNRLTLLFWMSCIVLAFLFPGHNNPPASPPTTAPQVSQIQTERRDPLTELMALLGPPNQLKQIVANASYFRAQTISVEGNCVILLSGQAYGRVEDVVAPPRSGVHMIACQQDATINLKGSFVCVFAGGVHNFTVDGNQFHVEGGGLVRISETGHIKVLPKPEGSSITFAPLQLVSASSPIDLEIIGAGQVLLSGHAHGFLQDCPKVVLSGNASGDLVSYCNDVTLLDHASANLTDCLNVLACNSSAVIVDGCGLTLCDHSEGWWPRHDCNKLSHIQPAVHVRDQAKLHAEGCPEIDAINNAQVEYTGDNTLVTRQEPAQVTKVDCINSVYTLGELEERIAHERSISEQARTEDLTENTQPRRPYHGPHSSAASINAQATVPYYPLYSPNSQYLHENSMRIDPFAKPPAPTSDYQPQVLAPPPTVPSYTDSNSTYQPSRSTCPQPVYRYSMPGYQTDQNQIYPPAAPGSNQTPMIAPPSVDYPHGGPLDLPPTNNQYPPHSFGCLEH